MTYRDHPTDIMGNPDGRDYHYRFQANDEEAWKYLRYARWKNRYIDLFPKDMEHLRIQIDHVTVKTYDKMGYIKGMKKYAMSPQWQKVPHSRGTMEMNNANGGGTKIRSKERIGEKWGTHYVEFHVDVTPSEIIDAYENGVNEDAITEEIQENKKWAVEDRVDELRELEAERVDECSHDHVVLKDWGTPYAYCEDCPEEWRDEVEFKHSRENNQLTVVGTTA